ncbi:long-chain-fatty-acid--CoA ligase FadD17 domain protein [Mycobacterium xenopi 4042]|uniref:Long-chain-fatty-acid--CoA ligase FadD17 domain protein n=1 Tax=Mycobacterium xenopi 4042 TaxID=1299334 RepID=X7ZYR5_MYCXE|nr:long-chain-fatty-acid--CoA ligase FadD17 domain protein [Mycobacterium xenopi 4042]
MAEALPTVVDLLRPLVDVDDRGVYFEDSFVNWRDHIQHGAAVGAALRAAWTRQTAARGRTVGKHPVLFGRAGCGWALRHRAGGSQPGASRRRAGPRHPPRRLPAGARRFEFCCGTR